MSVKNVEEQYYSGVNEFITEEQDNQFKRTVDKMDGKTLDSYAFALLNRVGTQVFGVLQDEVLRDYLFEELRLATRIGFCVSAFNNRFSISSADKRDYLKNRNKFSLRKLIINLLDRLNIK